MMKPDIVCPHCGNKLRKVPLSNLKAECGACEALFEYGKLGRQGPVLYPYIDPKLCRMCGNTLTGRRTMWCSSKCSVEFGRLCGWYVRVDGMRENRKRHGDRVRCDDCGRSPGEVRTGSDWGNGYFEVDHIVPVALGGSHDPSNLQVLCHSCHVNKTTSQIRLIKAGPGQATLAPFFNTTFRG